MKALELTKNVTTESLLTQFESRFGQTLNLTGMDQAQLEDMANMVRTKIHTITDNQHFGQGAFLIMQIGLFSLMLLK